MNYKRVLFVEDEAPQRDAFETAVKEWNDINKAAKGREIILEFAETAEDGREKIEQIRYDAALFDLRIKRKQPAPRAEPAGNELAKVALFDRGIPVAILTADDSKLDSDVRGAGALAVFDKNAPKDEIGDAYAQAVAWVGRQWGMMEILSASRRAMDGAAADIFVRRLWPRWKTFAELENDQDELGKIVTRQYVSHMAEAMGIDDPDNVSWHPFENYVSPSLLSARAHTGDIFRFGDDLWIVLTPQCDMAAKKVPNVVLAKCSQGIAEWAKHLEIFKSVTASNTQREKSEKFLRNHVNQNIELSKHFLPPLPGDTAPLLVDFSILKTEEMVTLNSSLNSRVASTSSSFLSNLIQRFGAYVSRLGQPNIDIARF